MAHELHVVRLIGAVADLTALLKDQGVPGAFIGGLAANLLGRPRITKDVDAVVLLGNLQVESFLAAAARFGFAPRISDATKFAAKNRVLLLIHEPSKTDVDISLGILPFEQDVLIAGLGSFQLQSGAGFGQPNDMLEISVGRPFVFFL